MPVIGVMQMTDGRAEIVTIYIYYIYCHTYPACKKQCSVNTNNIDSSGYVVLSVDSHCVTENHHFAMF